MKKIKQIAVVVYNYFRFCIKRIRNPKINIKMPVMISPKSSIDLDKNARLFVKSKFTLEESSYIGVRDGAEVSIGDTVYVNRNCVIVSHEKITIDDGVQIGPHVCIYDHDHDLYQRGKLVSKPIYIKKNVWISAGAIVLKGVTIGENSVIAAGCVVTHDVPDNTILIQKRKNEYVDMTKNYRWVGLNE